MAERNLVTSQSDFVVYRAATDNHDNLASWTLDKQFALQLCNAHFINPDKGSRKLFTKQISKGDKVVFIGNQNGYKQYEVIA